MKTAVMKTINTQLAIITILPALVLLQSCSSMGGAGSDAAYLNKNRGAANAQISREEGAQYRRQQGLTANEIQLENAKRRQTTDSIQEKSSATKSAVGAVRSLNSLRGLFK